jgi:GNAT superfamily N-acetyltransferase
LFDDYRAHYSRPPSPRVTRDWLDGQLAQHRLAVVAAICAGQACGFITTTVRPASLMLGTAWSIRDLYAAPQHRRGGIARALLQHVIDGARAGGDDRIGDVHPVQQRGEHRDLAGLGACVHLPQHHTAGMVEGGEQVAAVLSAMAGAA